PGAREPTTKAARLGVRTGRTRLSSARRASPAAPRDGRRRWCRPRPRDAALRGFGRAQHLRAIRRLTERILSRPSNVFADPLHKGSSVKHMVSYTLKPDRVADNERLAEAVYQALRASRPAGLRYA